jgi:hypothetical protein
MSNFFSSEEKKRTIKSRILCETKITETSTDSKIKIAPKMQKGSEMAIVNYTATLLMMNFMELILFVIDNVMSFSCHDRGFEPNVTLLSLMSSFLFEREQTLLPPLPTQYPDSSSYLRQKEHDFLQELRKLRIRKCCGSGSAIYWTSRIRHYLYVSDSGSGSGSFHH